MNLFFSCLKLQNPQKPQSPKPATVPQLSHSEINARIEFAFFSMGIGVAPADEREHSTNSDHSAVQETTDKKSARPKVRNS